MLGVAPRQSDDPPVHLSHTRRNTRVTNRTGCITPSLGSSCRRK